MIIIKIHGGLGNQMFQYALGRNLSLLHNVTFKIDSSYLHSTNQSGRSFILNDFNIILEEATTKEISAYRSVFQKIVDKIRPESKKKKISDISENSNIFNPNILNHSEGYFDGHWNNEKYFKNNEKIIRKDFTLKNPFGKKVRELAQKIALENTPVSLHIRRGDYVSIPKIASIYTTLPISYYEQAMKKILDKSPDAHFFVSSDDIDWIKKNFPKNYSSTFVSSPEISDCEELILMSKCKHNIIANSTFSWWGAYLNQNPDKIVIAPKNWFRDESKNNFDLIPNTWTKI